MSGLSPVVESALADLLRDRSPRCGIHGDLIVDRRCPTCDVTRRSYDHPDQSNHNQKEH